MKGKLSCDTSVTPLTRQYIVLKIIAMQVIVPSQVILIVKGLSLSWL